MMVSLIQDEVNHTAAPVVRSVVRAEKVVTGEARS
jgi:hypothetical protein